MSGITRGITGPCLVCPTITLLFLSINFYQFLVHGHGQREQIHSSSLVSWPEMMSGGGGGLSSSGQGVSGSNLVGCISSILLLFLALLIIQWYLLLLLLLSYLYLSLLCNSFFLCTLFPFLLSSLWILIPGPSLSLTLGSLSPSSSLVSTWPGECRHYLRTMPGPWLLPAMNRSSGRWSGDRGGGEDGTQPRLSLRCCSRHAGPLLELG